MIAGLAPSAHDKARGGKPKKIVGVEGWGVKAGTHLTLHFPVLQN